MAKKKSFIGILVFLLLFGATIIGCNGGKSNSSNWLISNIKINSFEHGSNEEYPRGWIYYKDDKHYKYQQRGSIWIREGNKESYSGGGMGITRTYDEESGLLLSIELVNVQRQPGNFTIELINTAAGGIKTYKHYDTETGGKGEYSLYKYKNKELMEYRRYLADDVLDRTDIYTIVDNPIIKKKLGIVTVQKSIYESDPAKNTEQTCEIVSDSPTELVISKKNYRGGTLVFQEDYTYTPRAILFEPIKVLERQVQLSIVEELDNNYTGGMEVTESLRLVKKSESEYTGSMSVQQRGWGRGGELEVDVIYDGKTIQWKARAQDYDFHGSYSRIFEKE